MRNDNSTRWAHWFAILFVIVSSIGIYASSAIDLFAFRSTNREYTYGFLVLFVAAFLLWKRRSERPKFADMDVRGVFILLLAAILFAAAKSEVRGNLSIWTIPIWIAGSVWLVCGKKYFIWCGPIIGFLCFAIPLPASIERAISLPLQTVSAIGSEHVFITLGYSALRVDHLLWVGEQVLEVRQSCSGLRILYGVFAIVVAFCLIRRTDWTVIAATLLAALPLAIFGNVTRIVLTGLARANLADESWRAWMHDGIGSLVTLATLISAVLIYRLVPAAWALVFRRPTFTSGIASALVALACVSCLGVLGFHQRHTDRVIPLLLRRNEELVAAGELDKAAKLMAHYANRYSDKPQVALARAMALEKDYPVNRKQLYSLYHAISNKSLTAFERAIALAFANEDFETAINLYENSKHPRHELSSEAISAYTKARFYAKQNNNNDIHEWSEMSQLLERAVQRKPDPSLVYCLAASRFLETTGENVDRLQAGEDEFDRFEQSNAFAPTMQFWRFVFVSRYGDPSSEKLAARWRKAGDGSEASQIELPSELLEHLLSAGLRHSRRNETDLADEVFAYCRTAAPLDHRCYLRHAEHLVGNDHENVSQRGLQLLKQGATTFPTRKWMFELAMAEALLVRGELKRCREFLELIRPQVATEGSEGLVTKIRTLDFALSKQEADDARTNQIVADLRAHLDGLKTVPRRNRDTVYSAWLELGRFYLSRHDPTGCMLAVRRAEPLSDNDREWRVLEARAHLQRGNTTAAIRLFQKGGDHATPAIYAQFADVMLRNEIRKPAKARDFAPLKEHLSRWQEINPQADQPTMLKARIAMSQRAWEAAEELLAGLTSRSPNCCEAWQLLCQIDIEHKDQKTALATIREFRKAVPTLDQSYLLESRLLAESSPELAMRVLKEAPQPTMEIEFERARLAHVIGATEKSASILRNAAINFPSERVRALEYLGCVLFETRQLAELDEVIGELRGLEGESGSGFAWRMLNAFRALDDFDPAGLPELEESIREALEKRPNWQPGLIVLSRLQRKAGRTYEAMWFLAQAWKVGPKTEELAEECFASLLSIGDREAAQEFLRAYNLFRRNNAVVEKRPPSEKVNTRNAKHDAGHDSGRDSHNPCYDEYLARVLLQAAQPNMRDRVRSAMFDRASKEYRARIDSQVANATDYLGLIRLHVVANNPQAARDWLKRLADFASVRAKVESNESWKDDVALATAYRLVGESQNAHKVMTQCVDEHVGVEKSVLIRLLQRATEYARHEDSASAEAFCRQVLELEPGLISARIQLATLLTQQTSTKDPLEQGWLEQGWLEQGWLEQNTLTQSADTKAMLAAEAQFARIPDQFFSIELRRLRIANGLRLAWAEKHLRTKTQEAQDALVSSSAAADIAALLRCSDKINEREAVDYFLRAQLFHLQGQFDETANALVLLLVFKETPRPLYIDVAKFCIRLEPEFDVKGTLDQILFRLSKQQDDVTVLKLRLARREYPLTRQVEYVKRYFVKSNSRQDQRVRDLISVFKVLIDQERWDVVDAIRTKTLDGLSQRVTDLSLAKLFSQFSTTTPRRIEETGKLAQQYPHDSEILSALSASMYLHGHYAESEKILRQLGRRNDGRMLRNNLALSIACQGRATEAIEMLNQQLATDPQNLELLDSLALVSILGDDPNRAQEILTPLVRRAPRPRFLLHLAIAQFRNQNGSTAIKTLAHARSEGLSRIRLTPNEAQMLAELHPANQLVDAQN